MSCPPWLAPYASRPVVATVRVPGSKSETNRAYVLAALSDGPSTITGALISRDTELMRAGLEAFGVAFTHPDSTDSPMAELPLRIAPPKNLSPAQGGINVGLAGTVLRFLPAVAAVVPGATSFYGDDRATERPVAPLLDALAALGVSVDGDRVPFTLHSPSSLPRQTVTIDASSSSQFVSALLLAGARYPQGIEINLVGPVPSRPHIDMTIAMLRARGVVVTETDTRFVVAPGTISARDEAIAPDLTNAAAFLAAGVLTGGRVEVLDWPETTNQPGDLIRNIITRFGGHVERTSTGVAAASAGPLTACDLDLGAASELTPVVAALAAFSGGTSRITGVGHIRGHETDRITAIVATLCAIGVDAYELNDGLCITGVNGEPHGASLSTYADHRMAHLGALVGLRVPGITLDDVATTVKTMPEFPQVWSAMLTETQPEPFTVGELV